MSSRRNICVFCGSNAGRDPTFMTAARDLGALIARRDLTLIYGGGNVGLMGAVADGALAGGAKVVGIIPHALERKEVAHCGLTELVVCDTMHDRKRMMTERSDAFIAMPGGYGTMEEFFEVITWAQLGIHRNPCGLLNVAGFYDGLIRFLDHAEGEALLKPEHRRMILVESDAGRLLDAMQSYQPPTVDKWIEPDQT